MKPVYKFLLIVSLIANGALVAFVVTHPATSDGSSAAGFVAGSRASAAGSSAVANADAFRAALASGNVAALQAAGLSAEQAREIVLGRALSRVVGRTLAQQRSGDNRWWTNKRSAGLSREEALKAQRELSDALIAAFGEDPIFGGLSDPPQLAFLPAEKRAALRRINEDYAEMMAKFGADGPQLASDREKLKLLRAERDRDIAALLTPAELADYEMRTSATAASVRSRYGDAIQSEDDFRKIYALQKAYDEKYPREALNGRIAPEVLQQRAAADRQLQDDLRAAVGDDKYAALRRAADTDLRAVDALVTRLNLPANTTDRVAAARESYATESQRINADQSIPVPQRRAQIQELGTRARSDLVSLLGAEATDAYVQRSTWANMLQGGIAYSTNPKDAPPAAGAFGGQGVYPVMPAGVNAAGGTRQVVNIVSGSRDGGGAASSGGMFFMPADAPMVHDVSQTISVMTSSSSSTPPATATTATPPPANPPPTTPKP